MENLGMLVNQQQSKKSHETHLCLKFDFFDQETVSEFNIRKGDSLAINILPKLLEKANKKHFGNMIELFVGIAELTRDFRENYETKIISSNSAAKITSYKRDLQVSMVRKNFVDLAHNNYKINKKLLLNILNVYEIQTKNKIIILWKKKMDYNNTTLLEMLMNKTILINQQQPV